MSGENDAVIQVSGLTKIFKDFWNRPKVKAVNGLDFEVRRGEVFGLLGPNGSGKSTTIKMILGLLHPTGGRIRVLGFSPRHVKSKSLIGYLPEESYLYNYLNARETLDFYGRLFDLNRNERKRRIDELLDMVGLKHTGRRMVGEFSKGMARRVGLAQALINDPEIVILDEPTSGLDPIGTRQVKDLIIKLSERGKTVILSSHLLADVEDVCDRIAILFNGHIQSTGPINELLQEDKRYQLTLPEIEPAVLQRVLDILRAELGTDPECRHPTRNLEQYFLEVITRARAQTHELSGAGPDTGVADFLTDEGPAKADVLEQLTREQEEEPEVREPAEPAAPENPPEPREAERRLEALTAGDPPAQSEPQPPPADTEAGTKPADPDETDRRLNDLLNRPGPEDRD